ncbi:MAG: DUF6883 domain-containing protein [Phycisphaeraceae bacterium]
MKMPNGDRAIVDDEKLYGFLVNLRHPRQAGHARLFKDLLSIDASNAGLLRQALLDGARDGEAVPGKFSQWGRKYEIRFQMLGLRRWYTILSVWIIRRDELVPRLVTAYPE